MTASVLIIVAMSAAFAQVLTIRAYRRADRHDRGMQLSPLASVRGQRIAACIRHFLEPLPGIVVNVPILAPVAHALGISDLQLGSS